MSEITHVLQLWTKVRRRLGMHLRTQAISLVLLVNGSWVEMPKQFSHWALTNIAFGIFEVLRKSDM